MPAMVKGTGAAEQGEYPADGPAVGQAGRVPAQVPLGAQVGDYGGKHVGQYLRGPDGARLAQSRRLKARADSTALRQPIGQWTVIVPVRHRAASGTGAAGMGGTFLRAGSHRAGRQTGRVTGAALMRASIDRPALWGVPVRWAAGR